MTITWKDMKKVLAMFDQEDIKYIDFKYIKNKYDIIYDKNTNYNSKVKVKKLGGKYDRTRA